MSQILRNKNLEIQIDLPFENYGLSRFDWTGKIVRVKFQGIELAGIERTDIKDENLLGKGFYNEFGIDTALGFQEAEIGGWFHKIGVGLCKKDNAPYHFSKRYEIKPAVFQTFAEGDRMTIICTSENVNGYAYLLKKEIELQESGFSIKYLLENTGEKDILTDEYVHNFLAVNKNLIGSNYILYFPFSLKKALFKEAINPELKVEISNLSITFNGTPEKDFFFSNLTGGEIVRAEWELRHLVSEIGIRETGNFQSDKVNLWGWKHVVCPELFYKIYLKPGKSVEWVRKYEFFRIV